MPRVLIELQVDVDVVQLSFFSRAMSVRLVSAFWTAVSTSMFDRHQCRRFAGLEPHRPEILPATDSGPAPAADPGPVLMRASAWMTDSSSLATSACASMMSIGAIVPTSTRV